MAATGVDGNAPGENVGTALLVLKEQARDEGRKPFCPEGTGWTSCICP